MPPKTAENAKTPSTMRSVNARCGVFVQLCGFRQIHDPGCIGNCDLGDIKDRHHDIKCVGENKDSAGGFVYALEENPVVQIR